MSNSKQPKLTHADLKQFTGDLDRYQHSLNRRVIYMPGVQFLAERGGAYWLIDAIASYFGDPLMKKAIARDDCLSTLQFWNLKVNDDRSAVLTMRADSGEKPAITQQIPNTDFPLDQIEVWAGFDGERWTLYLPSEH